ncbi:hypothetical protein [Burkholderia sp. Ac-20353]|nr:hypothetical protein [Burkholderia sp. Ac-20353]MBN3787728.1 hypothetical protein [Burkholderia sp. Ac-20353]
MNKIRLCIKELMISMADIAGAIRNAGAMLAALAGFYRRLADLDVK